MLTERLRPDGPDWFAAQQLEKAPRARPFAALDALPPLDWDTVDRVLSSTRPLDVLTVVAGQEIRIARPRARGDVAQLMASGLGVVVRAAEAHDPDLAALCESFEQVLPGEVHVQLSVTPAGTNSGGWHYDFEDAFVVQLAGANDYCFRSSTVATRLNARDWLYLPAGCWHRIRCIENSLSISVSAIPATSRAGADDDGRSLHARNQLRPL